MEGLWLKFVDLGRYLSNMLGVRSGFWHLNRTKVEVIRVIFWTPIEFLYTNSFYLNFEPLRFPQVPRRNDTGERGRGVAEERSARPRSGSMRRRGFLVTPVTRTLVSSIRLRVTGVVISMSAVHVARQVTGSAN